MGWGGALTLSPPPLNPPLHRVVLMPNMLFLICAFSFFPVVEFDFLLVLFHFVRFQFFSFFSVRLSPPLAAAVTLHGNQSHMTD